MLKKIAIISDIHGNSWALKEILDYIDNKDIDTIINLGDTFYGPLDPQGTWELIRNRNIVSIAGNEDLIFNRNFKGNKLLVSYLKKNLDYDATNWLKNLPSNLIIDNQIVCFHGTPNSIETYLIESINKNGICEINSNETLEDQLKEYNVPLILCGHSHLQHVIKLHSKTIINPGSVGCQAFYDDKPVFHKIENKSPHARFALIETDYNNVNVELIKLDYDWESAMYKAKENNFLEWAKWISTGMI